MKIIGKRETNNKHHIDIPNKNLQGTQLFKGGRAEGRAQDTIKQKVFYLVYGRSLYSTLRKEALVDRGQKRRPWLSYMIVGGTTNKSALLWKQRRYNFSVEWKKLTIDPTAVVCVLSRCPNLHRLNLDIFNVRK